MRPHPRGWPAALHPRLSPCRGADDRHPCSRAHAEAVSSYRAWRQQALDDAEAASGGYDAELADHFRDRPAPTFRAFLELTRQTAA